MIWGWAYTSLSKLNPRIILISITPFGQNGPYRDFKGPDIVVTALSGFLYVCGDEDRPPVRISFPRAYFHAASQAAVGTLIAYLYRQITNEGHHVDVSAQQSTVWLPIGIHEYFEIAGVIPRLLIPLNSASCSAPKRPLVPIGIGHPLSERSDAGVNRSFTQKSI